MQESIRLLKGDSLDLLTQIPDGAVDQIFADPPYNLSGKDYQTVHSGKLVNCDKGDWDIISDLETFNRAWIGECIRVLSDKGTLWISGTLHNHPSVGMILKEYGMWIINDIIWFKRNATPLFATNRFAPSTELIWLASKSKKYYFDYAKAKELNGGKQMKNLWEINAQRHLTKHPAEKPEVLLDWIIQIGSKPGDLVLDPFMGSGTTGVIARRRGRKFIGMEYDDEYFEIASKRINETPLSLFSH